MATITPVQSGVNAPVVVPSVPSNGADVIPAGSYNYVDLLIQSTTGTPTIVVDDPTSLNPGGTLVASGNFDLTVALTAGQVKLLRLDCSRFRDASGNINITTTTPANSTILAIGRL
jgi:hypothetical protein